MMVSKQFKEGVQLAALGIGVTILGLVVGAFLMSPTVSREQRLIALVALGGAAALVLLLEGATRALATIRRRTGPRAARRTAKVSRPATAAPPQVVLAQRSHKTPKTVQALAAAGAPRTEIAWKTGLPVDAVNMLLELRSH